VTARRRTPHVGAQPFARGWPDTRRRVCGGHLRSRANATCVHDPRHCARPDGRRRSNSVLGCGSTGVAVPGTQVGHTKKSKKKFCCVTTRRRNLGGFRCLRRGFGALAAQTLGLRVLCFGCGIQAASGLPPRRLPAADLPLTFEVLAVTLVPTPRLVLLPTALAQAHPCSRSSRASAVPARWITMTATHGSFGLPRGSPGRTRSRSPRALMQTE
jgi:hypothetical protein